MTGIGRFSAIAVSAAIMAASGATAFAKASHQDAFAQAPHHGLSEMDIRKQCYAEAQKRWPSTNQDMQKNREFAYSTCAVEHGVRNP